MQNGIKIKCRVTGEELTVLKTSHSTSIRFCISDVRMHDGSLDITTVYASPEDAKAVADTIYRLLKTKYVDLSPTVLGATTQEG